MTEAMNETRPTLLVVDDVSANIDILLEALGDDYTVRVATDGATALNSVKKAPPDLILLDIMMPGMDGFEVCRRLKDDPTTRDIPIIFLSALSEDADEESGLALGAVDYITKPFNPAIVKARIVNHLELRRQRNELQQSYNKLRELETMRDGLVHMIIHDMRSPLQGIMGSLEMAQDGQLPKMTESSISFALDSTKNLIEMVSTLLNVRKMEEGKMTLELSLVDMKELASEVVRMVEPLREQRRINLTLPAGMAVLSCDPQLVQRILQNLISNAIKFTDKVKGVITICIENAAANVMRIEVADNGPGIPPEYREKVFDKFCQVAARKEGRGYSTGLGLTFCKLAVETHSGCIGLESDMGRGSTFWFELPRLEYFNKQV